MSSLRTIAEVTHRVLTTKFKHPRFDVITRQRTSPANVRVLFETRPVDDQSTVGGKRATARLNPLYIGVPAACAAVLLSLCIISILLAKHQRQRFSDDRQKSRSLLPSSTTWVSSRPGEGFSQSQHHCVCLHCKLAAVPTFPVEPQSYALT